MGFHNLCELEKMPSNTTKLLGLGSKFCIQSRLPKTDLLNTFSSISRSIRIKCFMECISKESPQGIGNAKDLDFNPKLYVKSKFKPPLAAYFVEDELYKFRDMIAELHELLPQIPNYNLDKMQRLIISSLRNNPNIILINADKNQGLVALDRTTYIKAMLEQHCCDRNYYVHLSKTEAFYEMETAATKIKDTINKYKDDIPDIELTYFNRSFELKHRIPQLYGAPKLHKNKNKNGSFKFRPILSKCGSLPEVASKWIDVQLQSIDIASRVKDVFELLDDLHNVKLKPNTDYRMVSADAVSMYSNMNIDDTIATVRAYLLEFVPKDKIRFNMDLLIDLIEIVLRYNIYMFGDLYFKSIKGIAMGTCSAVMLSNIYVAYNEEKKIKPKYYLNMYLYRRFIDDTFFFWLLNHPNRFSLEDLVKDMHQCDLPWTITKPSTELIFLDIKISLDVASGKITTSTYEKEQNLHTYLPPYSAHAPGVIKGLIFGFVRRYWLQNDSQVDYTHMITKFVQRLRKRGHRLSIIKSLITEAALHFERKMCGKKTYIKPKSLTTKPENVLFYKAQFHPRGVPRSYIHQAFKVSLKKLKLYDRLTICYSRPPNIRDLLIPSKLRDFPGNNTSDVAREFKLLTI